MPVKNLFDYLKGGDSLDEFLEDFPSVRREQILELPDVKEMTLSSCSLRGDS
ncbi:MAG: DUF433 domain-containing protein [Cytophagaceae bacterium]|nr:DUF433 domain-containing protein [Cytophagaceae bacterium]